jgi:hypothetical protein
VFRVDRRSGPVWYAKYRLPDGRQVQKRIGPAWCRRGRPAPGFFTKRTAAAWLDEILRDAEVAGFARGEMRFDDAAREWLRYAGEDRACKPTTMRDYRNTVERRLMPFLGGVRLDAITPQMIETWRASLTSGARTKNKQLTILNAWIFLDSGRTTRCPVAGVSSGCLRCVVQTHASSGAAKAEAHPQLEPDAVGRRALLDRIGHAADEPEAETESWGVAT